MTAASFLDVCRDDTPQAADVTCRRSCSQREVPRLVGAPQTEPQGFGRPLDSRGAQPSRGNAVHMTDSNVLTRPKLLERDAEVAAVEGLVGVASGGRLLVIEGPPGIGKTALMAEAKAFAKEADLAVLSARGSELERSLPSPERAELLTGAASLAAPLFEPSQFVAEQPAESSLGTMHGLYWLAANAAADGPLLLVVDDLHWCDRPSLHWLAYLLPRIEGLNVSLLVGLREAEPGEDPELVDRIVTDPLGTVIRPAPLTRDAAGRGVRETLTSVAAEAFCDACWDETSGNPLLLREPVHVVATE